MLPICTVCSPRCSIWSAMAPNLSLSLLISITACWVVSLPWVVDTLERSASAAELAACSADWREEADSSSIVADVSVTEAACWLAVRSCWETVAAISLLAAESWVALAVISRLIVAASQRAMVIDNAMAPNMP